MKHYIYTKEHQIIDTTKCYSISISNGVATYRKTKFNSAVKETVLASVDSIPEVALLIISHMVNGVVFTEPGSISKGVYPEGLIAHIGKGRVLSSIWINTDEHTMVCWWNRKEGVLR